jgi:hypothetical protein
VEVAVVGKVKHCSPCEGQLHSFGFGKTVQAQINCKFSLTGMFLKGVLLGGTQECGNYESVMVFKGVLDKFDDMIQSSGTTHSCMFNNFNVTPNTSASGPI